MSETEVTRMPTGDSTDALIEWLKIETEFADDEIEAVVPAAINAVYEARNAGRHMHEAGAAAALAVLEAQNKLFRHEGS